MERYEQPDQWSFITKDLPSFSATEPNFIMFHPEEQKGIQCRFGERGVVAATHYDSGRNMVGMITGAKRYIVSTLLDVLLFRLIIDRRPLNCRFGSFLRRLPVVNSAFSPTRSLPYSATPS